MLDVPTRSISQNCSIFSDFLCANINAVFEESIFCKQLKYAGVKPVFKKILDQKWKITDLSVFCLLSPEYLQGIYRTSYRIILTRSYQKNDCNRQGFSVVISLSPIIEKFRESFDQSGACCIFTDLSKAVDCLLHMLLITKLHHCVKNVQIRSYFWSVCSCIRTEYGPT